MKIKYQMEARSKWRTLQDDGEVVVEDGRGSALSHLQTLADVGEPAWGLQSAEVVTVLVPELCGVIWGKGEELKDANEQYYPAHSVTWDKDVVPEYSTATENTCSGNESY